MGSRVAAELAGGDAPAAALCCRVAGDGGLGVLGLEIERAWVGEDLRIMRDPPVAFTGLGEGVRGGVCCEWWPSAAGLTGVWRSDRCRGL